MKRRRATALALVVLASTSVGCSPVGLVLACLIPQPSPRWHVWFEAEGLAVTDSRAEVDSDLRLSKDISLPLPVSYVARRDSYEFLLSTPLTYRPVISVEAKGPDGSIRSVKGREISWHTMAPPGRYSVRLRGPKDLIPLSGSIDVSVLDDADAQLGTERLNWKIAKYGTSWERDCL